MKYIELYETNSFNLLNESIKTEAQAKSSRGVLKNVGSKVDSFGPGSAGAGGARGKLKRGMTSRGLTMKNLGMGSMIAGNMNSKKAKETDQNADWFDKLVNAAQMKDDRTKDASLSPTSRSRQLSQDDGSSPSAARKTGSKHWANDDPIL